jgi:thioredoxin 1
MPRPNKKIMEFKFTDQNFEQEVLKSNEVVLVDFWAPWCGPCQAMGPVIEELAKEFEGKAKIGKCNVDENGEISEKFSIMSIPSIKIFKNGEVKKEFTGLQTKEGIKKALDELA